MSPRHHCSDQGLQDGLAAIRKTVGQRDRREHPRALLPDIGTGVLRRGRQPALQLRGQAGRSAPRSSRGRTSRRPVRAAAGRSRWRLAPSRQPSCPTRRLRWSGSKGPRRIPAPAGRRRPKSAHPRCSSAANRVGARVAAGAGAGESATGAGRLYTPETHRFGREGGPRAAGWRVESVPKPNCVIATHPWGSPTQSAGLGDSPYVIETIRWRRWRCACYPTKRIDAVTLEHLPSACNGCRREISGIMQCACGK